MEKLTEAERKTPVSRGRGVGRPMKCTQAVRSKLRIAFQKGRSIKDACHIAGIGASTFHRWKTIGQRETGFFRDLMKEMEKAIEDGGKRYVLQYYGEVRERLEEADEYEEAFDAAMTAELSDEEAEALAARYDAGLPINGVSPKP